jgi:acetyl esterase/lipase
MRADYKRSLVVASIVTLLKVMYKLSGKTLLSRQQRKNEPFVPKDLSQTIIHDVTVYEHLDHTSTTHLIYLHGGAYVHYGQSIHFGLLKTIRKQMNMSIHYIDYPLAPDSTVHQTTSKVINVIKSLQETYEGRFLIAGDSSGGGLALAIANQLSNIESYILLSPWLDVSISNPNVNDNEYNDGFYRKQELQACGTKYAPNEEQTPLASPMFLPTLPDVEIHMFTGSEDLLSPDIVTFEEEHPEVKLYYYKGAPHVFPLFPHTKEQRHFLSIIKSYL